MLADLLVLVLFIATAIGKNVDHSGFVGLNFNVARGNSFESSNPTNIPKFVKRADTEGSLTIQLDHQSTFYSVVLKIGSEQEEVTVLVDTGSSDLWVSSSSNEFCQTASRYNRYSCYGTFDETASTSFVSNDTAFFISYGDDTYAYGTYGYDDFVLDDLTVQDFSFAVANQSNSSIGVLGIGFEDLETTYTGDLADVSYDAYTYANFPSKLVQDGLINKRVYSLWLNEITEYSGNILFGAIDHAKYEGDLTVLPINNPYASYGYEALSFLVTMSSISIDSDKMTSYSYNALLDSGTTLSYLPYSAVSNIADVVGAEYSYYYGYYIMECPSPSNETKITYNFEGAEINVPLTDVVLTVDGYDFCVLGLMPTSSSYAILGDSFLRSAYVVYDLDNYQIGLAQAKYTNDTYIEVISGDIPGATTIEPSTTVSYSRTSSRTSSGTARRTSAAPEVTGFGNGTFPSESDSATTTRLSSSRTGSSSRLGSSSSTGSSSGLVSSAINGAFTDSMSSWTSLGVFAFFLLFI